MNVWQAIATPTPDTLIESRLQLHYAVQFIAATGAALAEALPDYSHTSLSWNPHLKAFVGPTIQGTNPFQVAIDPVAFALVVLNQQAEQVTTLPLHGKSMGEGLTWLKQEVAKRGQDPSAIVFLDYPPDDFPTHALAQGGLFEAGPEANRSELASYFHNTHALLQYVILAYEEVSEIHIWPHHFDIATLITLPKTQADQTLTIGVGLSPGDTSYHEPYWYVSPYPYPETTNLPAIAGDGFWHTQHWVGAVLPASCLHSGEDAIAQQHQVEAFLESAIKASIALLKPEPLES
ncbi:MAG TPA: hypothetical protein IGS53_27975 [Leptolyngbyaceae cyanobacterium M33_DOE_097]|uniref:Uncharacterized protein n=1 Tax=Oscillatoriales cyanobacterium SpSt-418 TaxID=2282169 RepID=A0A7C3KBU8_9CYAN|nr:hypothetical protein [Leptolyngbyaceae cyanobacterium M33_DOE_097]